MSTANSHYHFFLSSFLLSSNEQLVEYFNEETLQEGWTGVRGAYLAALQDAFKFKKIDYSAIGDDTGLSLNNRVQLDGIRLVLVY